MYKNVGTSPEKRESMDVGLRNVKASREVLKQHKIKIIDEEVLGNIPRTMELELETGKVTLKTQGMKSRVL